jgi:copper(I)-binding protein
LLDLNCYDFHSCLRTFCGRFGYYSLFFYQGKTMKTLSIVGSALLATLLSTSVWAQTVAVKDAWARATVQGQKATGAFMTLTAKDSAKLVSASSPVAGVVEVHEMKMDGDVMKMRAVKGGLDLPAGKAVELKPGGYHVMLMDLKVALQKDTTIPMTLVFKDAKGVETKADLTLPVSLAAPGAKAGDMPAMDHSMHKQ